MVLVVMVAEKAAVMVVAAEVADTVVAEGVEETVLARVATVEGAVALQEAASGAAAQVVVWAVGPSVAVVEVCLVSGLAVADLVAVVVTTAAGEGMGAPAANRGRGTCSRSRWYTS
jgi:hypothetical protein